MIGLDELLQAAAALEASLHRRGWQFCFIGGVAVQRWGIPRFTQDIDLTLLTGFGDEEKFVDALLEELKPRRADAREFALSRRLARANARGCGRGHRPWGAAVRGASDSPRQCVADS